MRQSLHQEEINDTELATWANYRMLLHHIFNLPRRVKNREEKLANMREYWQKKGKWTRKEKKSV